MNVKGRTSELVELISIEEEQLEEIHRLQNGELALELSEFMNLPISWVPLSLSEIRAKIEEMRKEERTSIFSIWSKNNEFVGLGYFSANWDPWCPYMNVIIWPQFRRRGYGRETAMLLLDAAFNNSIAHVVGCSAPDWNSDGIAFATSLGFKKAGAGRRFGIIEGKFFDQLYFDMLRDEYMAGHARQAGD